MPDMQKIYDAKLKRVEDARKVLEPDQIPIVPVFQAFPVYFANKWTIADIMADYRKATDESEFLRKY